jgi:hypothetical protein
MTALTLLPRIIPAISLLLLSAFPVSAATYYLDTDGGSDAASGTSPAEAWASLAKASSWSYGPGDQILLQSGDSFSGKLFLVQQAGASGNPIVVASYGAGPRPVIDASGYIAGVHIRNSQHIEVRDLEITGNGGAMVDGSPEGYRYGVYADCPWAGSINDLTFDNLHIHDIYPNVGTSSEGATPTTYMGSGIGVNGQDRDLSNHIVVRNCLIERVGFKAIDLKLASFVEILDNELLDIGGPVIQPGRVNDLVVRGNLVDGSGSFSDPRMHGRGSGIWPWTCERVLIEKNTFMGARGRADSCGIHIDFNCRDVVVQYNLSIDNAGGFIEILGNNYNCTYRYNISINDGSRVKGVIDQGTIPNNADGHTLWISGYVGGANPSSGPTNNYLYNNTVYASGGIDGTFSIEDTATGLLVANNIFYLESSSGDATPADQDSYDQSMVDHVVWMNNLYRVGGIVPTFVSDLNPSLSFTDSAPVNGNPLFVNKGGWSAADYVPQATALITDQGIVVEALPDDGIGLRVGLPVAKDFFGNPVIGLPDMGAVELGGTLIPLPEAGFSALPASGDGFSASMEAVAGPYNTEYFFSEISGNLGGDDSGWQSSPQYTDHGLLPNTVYAYTVTLRDSQEQAGPPSPVHEVPIPPRPPFADPLILTETFASAPVVDNEVSPYPMQAWYVAYETEDQANSVATTGGSLRLGWGYDHTIVLWRSGRFWNPAFPLRFSGDWQLDTVLDVHLGFVVGVGEFDPVTGELLKRVKEVTAGELAAPVNGLTGAFSLDLSIQEIADAAVSRLNHVGVYFEHAGALTPGRNDVYRVDNLELVELGNGIDTDEDGLPDSLEADLGLNAGNPADGALDLDRDGWSNADEFILGTNLESASASPVFRLQPNGGWLEVDLLGVSLQPGRLYILEHTSSLGSWTAVDAVSGSGSPAPSGPLFQFLPDSGSTFVRVRIEWE